MIFIFLLNITTFKYKHPSSQKISLEDINRCVLILVRWCLIWSMYFSVDHFEKWKKLSFSHHSFSLKKLFIAMHNRLCLVMSSSFCRRPNSQILADIHTFIVVFLQCILCFFSSTKTCCDPIKFQIYIYTLLKYSSCECPSLLHFGSVVPQNDKFRFLY